VTYKGRLSKYKVGKAHVQDWADYWIRYHQIMNSGSSVEGRMADYGHVIRSAFNPNSYSKIDEALNATPWHIKRTHNLICAIDKNWPSDKKAARIKQRQAAVLYYFGTTKELEEAYKDTGKNPNAEPNELKRLFERVGAAILK